VRNQYQKRRTYWAEHYQSGTTFVIHARAGAHAAETTKRVARFSKAIELLSLEGLFEKAGPSDSNVLAKV
jgi:hypothetical protein